MISISSRSRRLGLVVVAVALVAVALSGPALGQATNSSSTGAAGPQTVVAQVDSDLRVTNYSYNDEEEIFNVVLSNSGADPSQVTLTEAIDPSSDSSGFGIEQVRVDSGETVEVSVEMLTDGSGAGLMITTPESIDQGSGAFVSAETGYQFVSGSATWRDVQVGGVVGIGASILMTLLVSWHVVARKSADYEEVEIA